MGLDLADSGPKWSISAPQQGVKFKFFIPRDKYLKSYTSELNTVGHTKCTESILIIQISKVFNINVYIIVRVIIYKWWPGFRVTEIMVNPCHKAELNQCCPQFEFTQHSNLMMCEKLKQNQKLFKKELPTVLILISG